jgi:hypothetical protein
MRTKRGQTSTGTFRYDCACLAKPMACSPTACTDRVKNCSYCQQQYQKRSLNQCSGCEGFLLKNPDSRIRILTLRIRIRILPIA